MSNKSSLNNSYQSAPKAGASAPGEVEAWGLTQAALRMIQAQEKGDKQSMVDPFEPERRWVHDACALLGDGWVSS